ncbi:cytochrome C biogenesis protein [Pseudoxanthomonas yeongjuensis]|nr:cytochrome C biogenesis protein [Pseudoxanthomonas yeongjuensis]
MSANLAASLNSSFPHRRGFQQPHGWSSLFAFVPGKSKSRSDSRLRGNDDRCISLLRVLVLLALLLAPILCIAQVSDPTPLRFRDAAEETRFHQLTSELRCVMCQNQSLADSNAQIAHDLRREVLDLMNQGKSDAEIKRFLVERYGEFVLYKPEIQRDTWLLWFGPGLLLLAGAIVVVVIVRKRGAGGTVVSDDNQEW